MRKTTEAYDATHADLLRARDEAARLTDEQRMQHCSLEAKQAEKANLLKRLDEERLRNQQLTASLFDLENRCRSTDEQLQAAKREQNDLRFSNQSLQA